VEFSYVFSYYVFIVWDRRNTPKKERICGHRVIEAQKPGLGMLLPLTESLLELLKMKVWIVVANLSSSLLVIGMRRR